MHFNYELRAILKVSLYRRLLTNVPFLLLCLCNLFSTQGLYIPYVYLVELATSQGEHRHMQSTIYLMYSVFMKRTKACTIWWAGVAASSAAFLISVVGISNTIGRVISGAFTDLPFVRWSLWLFTHIHDQNVHTAPWWWQPSPWPWEQPALHSWPSVRPTGILTFILWVSKLDQDNDSKVFCRCVCHVWLLPLSLVGFSHRLIVLILDIYNEIVMI